MRVVCPADGAATIIMCFYIYKDRPGRNLPSGPERTRTPCRSGLHEFVRRSGSFSSAVDFWMAEKNVSEVWVRSAVEGGPRCWEQSERPEQLQLCHSTLYSVTF